MFDLEENELRIKELFLKNFRCFEDLSISFSTPYTVLIGINGSGKSSILDALRIFLDSFSNSVKLNQVHDISFVIYDLKILLSDIRREVMLNGSILESLPKYPTLVSGTVESSNGEIISWKRASIKYNDIEKNNNFESKQLVEYLNEIKNQFNSGKSIILPLIAHYGTNRRWIAKERNEEKINREIIPAEYEVPRLRGYSNCLTASIFHLEIMRNWFSRMLLIERKKSVPEFQAVKIAIANCYKNINDNEKLQDVTVDYDGEAEDIEIQQTFTDGKLEILPLHYLSDGAKSIIAIASDIAYRMAVLNPHLLNKVTEETDGIVLIDEIDMHLHPLWQRKVIDSLHETFPKVQFIFTTHSPTVLTNVPKENIRILDNGKIYTPDVNTKGRDVNSIIREIMHTDIRPSDVTKKLNAFAKAIELEDLNMAQQILDELRTQLGDNDSEVVGAQVTLDLERI